MTTIAIVTPWKNHLELADDYFEAVLPEMEDGDESIVVDDGSDPPLPFGGLVADAPLGFAGVSNFGLRAAEADAVLFLNNDIQLVTRGWLSLIRRALSPGVLVGPIRYGRHAEVDGFSLPWIDGWCLAGMREDLLTLGGFDEELQEPAYYCDNILSLEARAVGMTLREVQPGLRHLENRTAGSHWDEQVQAASAANRERYVARVRELLVAA